MPVYEAIIWPTSILEAKMPEAQLFLTTQVHDHQFPSGWAGGGSAIVTLAPVMRTDGLAFAALGLENMLNAGGAVLSASLEAWHDRNAPRCFPLWTWPHSWCCDHVIKILQPISP